MKRFAGGILIHEGKILLGLRQPHKENYPNRWDIIGGHCLDGELYSSAMIRELKEELGIIVTAFDEFMIVDKSPEFAMKLFLVTGWQGLPTNQAPEEHSKIEWFTIAKAKELIFFSPDYITMLDIISERI
jgi:8-oxo-dGTP diphosphatase